MRTQSTKRPKLMRKNGKTHANTINPPVQTGVNNQKTGSLSPLINPRFLSIERLRALPQPPAALQRSTFDMKTLPAPFACPLVLLPLAACGDDDDDDTTTTP